MAQSNLATVTITVSPVNDSPMANAGADQTVNEGSAVSLNGTTSYDADGDILSFSWTRTSIPAGSIATLSGAATGSPTFIADLPGGYIVDLTVSDGILSSTDSVTITSVPNTLVGEGLKLSKNSDFSTEDIVFEFWETMYILVWSDQLDYNTVNEARWQLEGAEETLLNNFDGTYTAQVLIDDNVTTAQPTRSCGK